MGLDGGRDPGSSGEESTTEALRGVEEVRKGKGETGDALVMTGGGRVDNENDVERV